MHSNNSIFSNLSFHLNRKMKKPNQLKTKIAVATVNGRVYYELVNELQRKKLPFLSLKPWDFIPLNIEVVISTENECSQISHPTVLLFKKGSKPESVVDEAILIIQGKQGYERIVIGVDPGNSCGIAILGDNTLLETKTTSNIWNAVYLIINNLKRFPAKIRIVRIGDGTPQYTKNLLDLLDAGLPEDTLIELVAEAGTSRLAYKSVNRRMVRDAVSAIKIAGRNGRSFSRRAFHETCCR